MILLEQNQKKGGDYDMRRLLVYGIALTMSISILGCNPSKDKIAGAENHIEEVDVDVENLEEVRNTVKEFGGKLQLVYLLAPENVLEESMKENYGGLVTSELIEKWLKEPENAPGRLVSSPWPDRIEILDIERVSESKYDVEGEIVEITSNEDEKDITRPIILTVEKTDENWIISDVVLGEYNE